MGKLAGMVYTDLMARGRKRDTAVRWRTWDRGTVEDVGSKSWQK